MSEDRTQMSQFNQTKTIRLSSALLFYSGPWWMWWCLLALVRGSFFTQVTYSKANLILRHPHRHTRECLPAIWASLRPGRLIHKINHHKETLWSCSLRQLMPQPGSKSLCFAVPITANLSHSLFKNKMLFVFQPHSPNSHSQPPGRGQGLETGLSHVANDLVNHTHATKPQ